MAGFSADINLQVRGTQQVLSEIQKVEKEIDRLQKKSAFNLGGGMSDARRQANLLQTDKKRLQIQLDYEKAEKRILKSYNTRQRANRFRLEQEKKITAELNRQARIQEREAKQRQKDSANRVQNAALGVGFPLLFGGGPGSILGGGLGALAGGFGGSVIASGLGAQLDAFAQKAAELGQALNDPTNNLEVITDSLGAVGTETEKYIAYLNDTEREAEAAAVATAELVELLGRDGVAALKQFGSDTTDLSNEFTVAMTQMQAAVADLINQTGILKALTEGLSFGNALRQAEGLRGRDSEITGLLEERDQANRGTLFGGDPGRVLEINERLVELVKERNRLREEGNAQNLRDLQEEDRIEKEILDAQKEKARVIKENERAAARAAAAAEREAKAAKRAAEREAERARKLEERLQKQIRFDLLSAANAQEQQRLDNLESQARIDNDKFALIEIQKERQLLELAVARQKALEGITDQRRIASIGLDFDAREDRVRNTADNQATELVVANGRAADAQELALRNQLQLVTALTEEEKRRVKLAQDLAKIEKNDAGLADGDVERLKAATIALSEGEAAAERYNQVLQNTQEVAGALSNNVLNGIRAVVEGTATAEEAFASFLDTIVDLLLKAAAEQIAAYIAIGIARQFAGFGSPDIGAGGGEINGRGTLGPNYGIPQREIGGRTMANMPYVVGEKGPELFVPGKTGTVVPADVFEATRAALSGGPEGGDTDAFDQNSIALGTSSSMSRERTLERAFEQNRNEPIDVRYEAVVINDVSYVTTDEFEKGIRRSVQQSKSSVFRDLKNKPSARAGVGL